MRTTQAWGWLVAGVLAAGLNASYHDGNMEWAHRVADEVQDRSDVVLSQVSDRISEQGNLILARAEQLSGRTETASCRLSTTLEQVERNAARTDQAFARILVNTDRGNAQLARAGANREVRLALADAHVRMSAASFQAMNFQGMNFQPMSFRSISFQPIVVRVPVVCSRVRVSVPRVDIPRVSIPKIPMVRIPASVHIEMPGAGPV
jgi:hypothetical protein